LPVSNLERNFSGSKREIAAQGAFGPDDLVPDEDLAGIVTGELEHVNPRVLNLEHAFGLDRDVSSLSGEAPKLVAAFDLERDRARPDLAVDENLERGAWMKRAAPPRGKKDERKEEEPPEGESASPEPAFSRRREPEE
jgi:hypothetical protein